MAAISSSRLLATMAVTGLFIFHSVSPAAQSPRPTQTPTREVVIVPGFNALAGQHDVELRVWTEGRLQSVLSAAAIESAAAEPLRRAGMRVTNWTTSASTRPALQVMLYGGITGEDEVLYYVSVGYFIPLRVSLSKPPRAKKVGVYHDGSFGVIRRSLAPDAVASAVSSVVGRFVQNAYARANGGPGLPVTRSWAPPDFVTDTKEAMKGFPNPSRSHLAVHVDASAPVSTADVQSAAAEALQRMGLSVDTGSYFMSIYPQVLVSINAATGTRGRLMYTIRVEYRRNMDIEPDTTRIRLVMGTVALSEGTGLGDATFAKPDILDSVRQRITDMMTPHLEANGIR